MHLAEIIQHLNEKTDGLSTLTPEDHGSKESNKKSWNRIEKQIRGAKNTGQGVTYRREGGIGNKEVFSLAKALAKKLDVDFEDASLEHPEADIDNPKSLIRKQIIKRYGKSKADAANHAFHVGQGRNPKEVKINKSAEEELKASGLDSKEKMYKATFPRDSGAKETWYSDISDSYNRARRDGFFKLIQLDKDKGRITIGTLGRSHIENPDYV